MITLKIENNDLVLTNGQLQTVSGIDALVTIINNRIKLWLGEFDLAPTSGIDYLGLFNQKKIFMEERLRKLIRDAILADTHITKIKSLEVSLDNGTREVTGTFEAETDYGLINGVI